MPKTRYVTITLTEHEAYLVSAEIQVASLGDCQSSKARGDLARASIKIREALMRGHNKPPMASLVAQLVLVLGKLAGLPGSWPIYTRSDVDDARALIARVQGNEPGSA